MKMRLEGPIPTAYEASRMEAKLQLWRLILALCLLLFIGIVNAGEISASCTPPTKYTDGSNITGTMTYRFYYGTALPLTQAVDAGICATKITVPDPAPGASVTYLVQATATAGGVESGRSNTATKTFATPKPTPNPPTALTAAAGATAYAIKPDYTTFGPMQVSAQIGTVRTRTSCTARQRIVGTNLYRVPKTAVAFSGKAQDYVVAMCG